MDHQIKIAVRPLVEYVYRSGSIESGFRSVTTLTEGTKAHRKVQKDYSDNDESEVFLQTEMVYDHLLFVIEGRCDGLLRLEDGVTIDEIKSTSGNLQEITEDTYPVHWAQAKCYAYMYAKQHEFSEINVQLTYIQKETEETKKFRSKFHFQDLEDFMFMLLKSYAPYGKWLKEHEQELKNSARDLTFPYEAYRKGQRQLAASVYKTIVDEKTLFATAPTGIGKTISTLFPAVKAIGEGNLKKIFYLTARTTTRQTAEEALRLMRNNGLNAKSVTITAKDKICFTEEKICTKEHCPFADGFYDRINDAVLDILSNESELTRETIEIYARKHMVCPFEYSLELAYAADAVICDYNYIFDPRVSLKRIFDEIKKQTVLLVDEVHNLVDRARDMYSASLEKRMFLELKRLFKHSHVFESTKLINDFFLRIRKQANGEQYQVLQEVDEEFNRLIEKFIEDAEQELFRGVEGENGQALLDAYFAALSWSRITKLYDEQYVTYIEVIRNEVMIKMFCLDPSTVVHQAGKSFKARIYFSATLSPLNYFMLMLGAKDDDYTVSIPSPFSKEQTDVRVHSLSTRYRDREESIMPIVQSIEEVITERPGNYIIFFPSYQYMNRVFDEWTVRDTGISTIIQGPGMTETEREDFLLKFQPDQKDSLIAFAVLGGIFSEGVDLKGDRLNGVFLVGVGLPQIGFERELIKKYFNDIGKNGYDISYVFPGMNKILQAGGRLIRTETDKGIIVLFDDRYLQTKYKRMMPEEWRDFEVF
ncbi:ATP-dependent DNA helicase [Lederbergia wuyishanensis]|uniref:Rad3-related DNA helicase n=1 Tax=Lederbergia wuyishanensis TaxID=1347903 RepID=A0ABU0D6G9_9BACI|nr:ATP-dependent DNA helicase [Lederbergia wuyishanensis]MCJ8008572.1 ATP-dependent DNA helicase [Lederbergia wuyishanensis]MDQ0344013.1 Rad3-related DNA helicase [Lederbergia wuyishanensis]